MYVLGNDIDFMLAILYKLWNTEVEVSTFHPAESEASLESMGFSDPSAYSHTECE